MLTHEFDSKITKVYFNECIAAISTEMEHHYQRFGFTVNLTNYFDVFLSYRMVSAASMIYSLYYYNNWRYSKSKVSSQATFKYRPNSHSPVFLFRMARQFKNWKFVKYYFAYEPFRLYYNMKTSKLYKSIKTTKLWHKLKGSR